MWPSQGLLAFREQVLDGRGRLTVPSAGALTRPTAGEREPTREHDEGPAASAQGVMSSS